MTDASEVRIGAMLTAKAWRLVTAESCTGGLIAHRITNVPGSSGYFDRGFICYSNEAKTELLGVAPGIIADHGAVSAQTAVAMAQGALEKSGADAAVAVTGIAGPGGGSPAKPVGLVYIAVAGRDGAEVQRHNFDGSREEIKSATAEQALAMLESFLAPVHSH
ncbi:MAG: CinA family protein [Nitrospirota bacterium]|nr:CinA family protein [Nitrospirota bacterium]